MTRGHIFFVCRYLGQFGLNSETERNYTEPQGEEDKCDPVAERAAMADGQGSVSVSPSGGRVVGCPHSYLYFVDGVELDCLGQS